MIKEWGGHAAMAALVTPFTADGAIDHDRMAAHAIELLGRGLDGVVPFGTTGEGSSASSAEKWVAVGALLAAGVPKDRVVLGINVTSVDAAVTDIARALDAGLAGALLPPPFYFRSVSESAVLRWFETVIEGLGERARGIIPYNIPSVAGVHVTPEMVAALKRRFGDVIAAVKDSSCDIPTTERFLAVSNTPVMVGHEGHLAGMVRKGAVGTISGLNNLVPERISAVVRTGREDPALSESVDVVISYPVTPAVKALVAHVKGDAAWAAPRLPLEALPAADAAALIDRWNRLYERQAA
ncbi:dihydrodipicolinate synthase family protein [Azospirillum sp. RWY-5-1]|uniref:Dihydrodipicolinate synthase family protein n=1 Tax=Azospirillum oleiclasticum TaxID=2735135 RepID=A0ABX2TK04_9PROT|nr:dihydrodipicolinate synthase family protein [Azospirillum oleiclasticum]NYZ23483.1 dihydrodipicolinate synthase family protein [Azospirillum oleiclasticum]